MKLFRLHWHCLVHPRVIRQPQGYALRCTLAGGPWGTPTLEPHLTHYHNSNLMEITHNSNLMDNFFYCNSITGKQITTKFCTCHDSCAVMTCAKYCSDCFIIVGMRAWQEYHWIWILIEKQLVKFALEIPKATRALANHHNKASMGV